jgi:hypothetical protein
MKVISSVVSFARNTSYSIDGAVILFAICFMEALWLMPSVRCQNENTSGNTRSKNTPEPGFIADVDNTIPSKEELLQARLNLGENSAKGSLFGKAFTGKTGTISFGKWKFDLPVFTTSYGAIKEPSADLEKRKELLKPSVDKEWRSLQPVDRKLRKLVPVVQPVKRRTPEEFLRYVHDEVAPQLNKKGHWKPVFIALHNTSAPDLHGRPQGFTKQHIEDLRYYYGVVEGWKAGPAAFVDDYGIWVFNGFTTEGRHSPCWNKLSWGIEQLGEFEVDEYESGRGARVRDNAIAALAILSVSQGFDATSLRFHKEDTCTKHTDCPGRKCKKVAVQDALARSIAVWKQRWEELSPPATRP